MHETIFALKRAYQATRNSIDEGLAAYGLSWAQLDILLLLHRYGVQEQRELQLAMGVTSATLTRTVDGLVKRGFVSRVLSDDDARVKQLHL
jgi:DNA-binding MarR family transcriptional regulator